VILVIDPGTGNLRSVGKALEACGAKIKISSNPRDVQKADKLVLPGVGAFPDAVKELKKKRLWTALKQAVGKGKPLMGICLGYQLLFSSSEEGGRKTQGLGLIPGAVKQFPVKRFKRKGFKVPHMGWNRLKQCKASGLLKGVKNNSYFYFVHSYRPLVKNKKDILGVADYEETFAAAVQRGNVSGFQFHPEKSQKAGLQILRNFIKQ